MARLHSRKKGKSGRKQPKAKAAPSFVTISAEELGDIIIKMAKDGVRQSKIGLVLRDKYGIPSAKPILGMPIGTFLRKAGVAPQYPEDLLDLIRKAVRVRTHLKKARKDVHNKVKLTHIESKIARLVKYYRAKKRLPAGWKYDPESAALLVK